MKWVHHYTGHDYAEANWHGINLYLNRDSNTQKLTFVRLSWRAWPHTWHRMLGVFIGRLNMLQHVSHSWGGWEVFTGNVGFGWCGGEFKTYRSSWFDADLHQRRLALRAWRLGLVFRVPQFVQHWVDERAQCAWAKEAEAYEMHLRKEMGEEGYAAYCAQYAGAECDAYSRDELGDWHGRNY